MGVVDVGLLKRWSSALRRGVALLPLAAGATTAQAQSLGPAGNVIIPDGRTATNLSVNGATTDVTTGTMAGGNAYNSFSRFEVGENNTVNLHVPTSAGHLINIVRDAPVVVGGTLNAMKDGRIGGNVVFADPYGFIVNKKGVVNAGSLTVNTPTREFLEQTLDSAGRINAAMGARIVNGDIPLSPDGSIVIKGRVNTETGVALKAQSVTVSGPERHKEQFEATVNTDGRRDGGQIVVRNGKLQIVAAGSAKVGGRLSAGGGSRGGDIQILAGAALKVLPTARIEALRANDAETLNAAFDAVNRDTAGRISITSAGELSVAGSIVAEGSVHAGGTVGLSGRGVAIEAGTEIAATTAAASGRPAALSAAKVDIRSAGDLRLDGKVSADGAGGRSGGAINVLATNDIALASTAELSANGVGGEGGRIIVFADRNLDVANGFTVKAAAGETGDGGFVELSAKKVVELATVNLDLGAKNGRAGTLLIDPENVVIGADVGAADTTYFASQLTNGANYSLTATGSITVNGGYKIDTRQMDVQGVSTGNSGNVTLSAPRVTLDANSQILAGVNNPTTGAQYTAGDVTLSASQIPTSVAIFGDSTFDSLDNQRESRIDFSGKITGRTVTINAIAEYEVGSLHAGTRTEINLNGTIEATTVNVLSRAVARANYNDPANPFGVIQGVVSLLNPLGIDAAFVSASATAHLKVHGGTNITADTVKLESLAVGEAVDQAVGFGTGSTTHMSASAVIGMVDTDAVTDIASDAQINAKTSLGIGAVTDTRLNALSSVISGIPFVGQVSGATAVGAAAYGEADVNANATVHTGAKLTGTGAVTVLARSDNAFSVNAKVYGTGQTSVGGTIAISDVNSNTVARLGADVDNTASTTARDVSVQAISNVKTHDTAASTTTGTAAFSTFLAAAGTTGNLLGGATPNVAGITSLIASKLSSTPSVPGSNNFLKAAGSLALSSGSITADSSISADTGAAAPVIKAGGNISVVSDLASRKIVSNSGSGVNSNAEKPEPGNTSATVGAAVAVSVFDVDHYSRAWAGKSVTLQGSNVGVNAYTYVPTGIFLSNWESFEQVFLDLVGAFVSNPGLITSGAKATAESDTASLAGSYNHFDFSGETTAWIGTGATVTSTGAGGQWQVDKLDKIGAAETSGGNAVKFDFQTAVDVLADTYLESLNVMGNWGLSGNTSRGSAVGGSAGSILFDVATVAGIADSANVTSASTLSVDAKSKNFMLAMSPSNGSGSSLAGSGLVAVVQVDDKTHSSISNTANVTANLVSVVAEETLEIYAASGQLQRGAGTSIGAAITIVDIDTDTAAYIGDNYGEGGDDVGPQTRAAANTQGSVTTDEMTVRAVTNGSVVAASVAATVSDPVPAPAPPPGTPSKALELLMGSQTTSSAQPKFNLTISGSSSVIVNELDTRGLIDNVDIVRRNSSSPGVMRVEAINTSNIYSVSGSAAISLGGLGSSGSAGVAGAIALGASSNRTIASLSDSDVTDMRNVAVQALTGGGYTVSAVGLSGAGGSSDLLTLAGSVSIAEIADTVQGLVSGSDIDGPGGGALAVNAYRKTEVSIGGGSMGIGGKAGAGIGLTYTTIRDNDDGYAAEASITDSSVQDYQDVSVVAAAPSRIYSGAAAASLLATNGLSGAIVVNDIGGTILASIDTDEAGHEIQATGNINVKSGTADADDLNALLSATARGENTAANNYAVVKYQNAENGAATEVAAGAAIVAIAGNISFGDNNIGASIVSNSVHQRHVARIAGADIDAGGGVNVVATDTTSILALSVGVGVATGGFAGQAAIVDNRVNSSISAEIGKSGRRTAIEAGGLAVKAQDAVVIRGSATSATLSSGLAAGIGIAVNSIGMDVDALIGNAEIDTSGSVSLVSASQADILTIAAGVAGGSSSALAGSSAASKIDTDVRALVSGSSDIDAGNNVVIDAHNSGRISVVAGAVAVGLGGAGVGLSVVVNEIGGDTEARIADSTVDANGNGADQLLQAGALVEALEPGDVQNMRFGTPDFTQQTRFVSGLAVLASSTQTVTGIAVTVGLAGAGPAAAILPVTTVVGGSTVAAIDRSSAGTRLNTTSDILVSASSHSFSGNFALGGAGSASAMAGAATSVATTMKRSTDARISNATIGSTSMPAQPGNVKVQAYASQSASDISIGLAAGLIGGASGSAIVTVFNADTEAAIEGGTLRAGSTDVVADSTNGYFAAAGAGAGGLFGGYAGAAVIGVSKNTTVARIGAAGVSTVLNLNGNLGVSSASHNVFTSHAYGFAGGVVGTPIAGMALVTVVGNDTQAMLRDATINIASDATVNDVPVGISLSAHEDVDVTPTTGGGGVAIVGAGFGAAANVVVLTSKVLAGSSGGNISAPGVFDISATTDKTIDAKTITIGGGLGGGVGAAVGVVIAGGATAADAMAELNKGGDGTLANLNDVSAGGQDFVLALDDIATWRSRAVAAGISSPSDAQVQAWARARYVELLQGGSFRNDGTYVPNPQLSSAQQTAAINDFAALTRDRAAYVLADDQLLSYSSKALNGTEQTAFAALVAANDSSGINFTPKAGVLAQYAAEARTALGLSGTPTDAQIRSYLEARYEGFVAAIRASADADYTALLAKGTVDGGRLVIDAANLGSLASSMLSTDDATLFTTLSGAKTSSSTFALTSVDAVYANGKTYRQAAAEALGIDLSGPAKDQQVQDYWAARYNALTRVIQANADTKYRDMVGSQISARSSFSVTNAASNASEGVYAGIDGGVVAVGSVAIDAISSVSATNMSTGIGVGVFANAGGAALSYTESNATVAAYVAGNVTANAIVANATARNSGDGPAARSEAYAGAGGMAAAVGAAAAVSKANNNVTATLGGTLTGRGSTTTVFANAMDTTTQESEAIGATAAGGIAIGASIADSRKSSKVETTLVAGGVATNWGEVSLNAGTGGALYSKAVAGAGGMGVALGGAIARSVGTEQVTASIGNGASVSAVSVEVMATAVPKLTSEAIGVTVSHGVALGVSMAESLSSAVVKAFAGNGVTVAGGGLNIVASAVAPSSGDTAWSRAVAGTGGGLVGANATIANSMSSSKVEAYTGTGLRMPNGDVSIAAVNNSRQKSISTGIAVGFVGAGATRSESSSSGWSKAWLGDGAITLSNRTGALTVNASGTSENRADSTAGSGGVVAGSAAIARTSDTSTTVAEIKSAAGYTLYVGGMAVEARHDSVFRGNADSFQASAFGASGADSRNVVNSTVTANIAADMIIHSRDSVFITATSMTGQDGGGARTASGGVVSGAASLSDTKVNNTTTVNIGESTVISLNGDPTTATGKIDIEAFNQLIAGDTIRVDSGGYYSGGGGESKLLATIKNEVNIGANAHLFSVGGLQVGTASVNMSNNNANASLYGIVTGAGASSNSVINVEQNVKLENNVTLEAYGDLTVTAGQSGNGFYASLISARATTEVYNYALIPISASYRGNAEARNLVSLTMGTGGKLLAGQDIRVGAYYGTVSAEGRGTNHNPYLALFNTTKSDDNSMRTVSSAVTLNGTVYAGINNKQQITIDRDGRVTLADQDFDFQFTEVAAADVATTYFTYNQRRLNYDIANTYNPYADIVSNIMRLTGLDEGTVRWRLQTRNDMLYGVTVSDDNRRQTEAFVNQIYAGGIPDRQVGSVAIGSMWASAGSVTINADTLSGSARITAKGAPRIDVVNSSLNYVLLNKLLLTTNEGGRVDFTGGASSAAGIIVSTDTNPAKPEISIRSIWDDRDHLGNPIIPTVTPDIYFLGGVSNFNGVVTVRNAVGNVTILGNSFEAATIDMQVPRGNLSVNWGAGTIYETNNDVMAQWRGPNNQYRPTNVADAVAAVATYLEPQANTLLNGQAANNAQFTARTIVRQYFGTIPGGPSTPSALVSDIWFKMYRDDIAVQPTQTGERSYWDEGWYRGEAYSGDDSSGPFGWARFDVIQRQGLLYRADNASAPPSSVPQIIGGSIIITAGIINVNGTIQSGFSNSYSVNLGDAAKSVIASYRDNPAARAANAGRFIELPVSSYGGDSTIRAYYDVSNDRIELQNVVQGAGGRVYLNGGIISTSTRAGENQGLIRVNGGYATVNIVNTTGTGLVTNTINTGVSTTSTVEIVDQFKRANGAPIRTWYVYDVSNPTTPLTVYQQTNGSNNTDYRSANNRWTVNGTTTTYDPQQNLLYQWVESATAVRADSVNADIISDWVWERGGDPYQLVSRSVISGTQDSNFREVVTGEASYQTINTWVDSAYGTDFEGNWEQHVYNRATIWLTNTVRASNPINIQFIGGSTGVVSIDSNASVKINDAITNYNGSTNIRTTGTSSAITASREGSVSGRSITLYGEGGIGTADQALAIQVYGGTLTANSVNSDINISARGDVNVAAVKVNGRNGQALTAGNVTLSATGDIYSSVPYDIVTPIVVGKSVALNSASGAIGARTTLVDGQQTLTNINPIVIQASGIALSNGSVDGGVLDSTSSTGAYIVQSRGDLRVGKVISNGAVFLAAAASDGRAANIVAGASRTGISAAESQRLENVWGSLDLLREATQDGTVGADGNANTDVFAGSAAVHGYEAMINRAYEDYWQLRTVAFADGATYALTDAGRTALKAQIAAASGEEPEDIGDELVEEEARRRFAIARSLLGLDETINDTYEAYWNLRALGYVGADGENYSISAQGSATIKAELAAIRGVPANTITDAEVRTEVVRRYAAIRPLLGITAGGYRLELPDDQLENFRVLPTTSALTTALGGYTQGFSYQLAENTELYASLTSGASWTRDQLTYTIDAAANPASNTPMPTIGRLPENVDARQIMLYTPNGSIGSLAPPRTIVFRSDNLGALSEVDRAAIAAAGPGELKVDQRALAGGAVEYTVTLTQRDLFVASALGTVAAKAKSEIYLASASELKLGGVPQGMFPGGALAASYAQGVTTAPGGTVRLEAVGNVVGGVAGQVAISGEIANLTIISETGSIGRPGAAGSDPAQNSNALLIALTGSDTGTLNLAQAAQGIYIRQTTGDLILGNIAGGSGDQANVQLAASGSIYAQAQFTDRTVPHILGSTLDLRAGGSISFRNGTFQPLQVAITGAVTGYAAGDITILSPTTGLTVGKAGGFGTLGAGGDLVLNSTGGALTLKRSVTAGDDMTLVASGALSFADEDDDEAVEAKAANGDINVTAGSLGMGAGSRILAGGTVDVLTTGNAVIGQIRSTATGNATVPVIRVTTGATGSILGNGDDVADLLAAAAAGVNLSAGAGIDLDVSTGWLNATVSTGNLVLRTEGTLKSTTLASAIGAVNVTAAGLLDLASVVSGTNATLTSTGGSIDLGTLAAGGNAILDAHDDIDADDIGADGSVTADAGGSIGVTTLAAGGSVTGTSGTGITVTSVNAGAFIDLTAGTTISAADMLAGTSVDLDAGRGILVTTLTTGGSATLFADGAIAIATLTAGSSVTSTAGTDITVTSLDAGTSADLDAGRDILVTTLTTGGSVMLAADGAVDITTLTTGGFATLSADGAIDIGTLDIGTVLTSNAGTTTVFGTTGAGTSMTVTSGGLIDMATTTMAGTGDTRLTSTGGSIDLGTFAAGGNAILDAHDGIDADDIGADGSVTADAGGSIGVTTLAAGGSVTGTAGADITVTSLDAGTSADLDAGSDILVTTLTTGSSAMLASDGAVDITTLTTGDFATLFADGAIDIATLDIGTVLTSSAGTTTRFGTTGAGTSMTVSSGGLIDMAATTMAGAGDTRLTSTGGSIDLGTLTAGGNIILDAHDSINADDVGADGSVTADAGGSIGVTTLAAGGSVTGTAGADIAVTSVNAGAFIDLTAGTTISAADLRAGTSASLDTGSDTRVTTLITGGSATLFADGAIAIATLTAGSSVTSTSGAGIAITSLDAGTSADLDAGSDILVTTLTTGSSAMLAAGDAIDIATLTTGNSATLVADGAIDIATLDIGTVLTSSAGTTTVFGTTGAGTSMTVSSGGLIDMATTTMTGTGDTKLTSTGGSIDLGTLTAGGNIILDAHDSINADDVGADGSVTADAGGSIGVTTLAAGGSVTSTSGVGITVTSVNAGAFIDLTAGTTISAADLRAGTSASLDAGSDIRVTTLTTGSSTTL
ncbi:leukotoxin LktA family filamentous adhesin, partial [Rhizobium terrae]|uniref:leukotoxin LktA family filamentous adhesin n=1 Tax=Rhizobium terrae TaxID=2171756 RepID=UPI000E3C13E6